LDVVAEVVVWVFHAFSQTHFFHHSVGFFALFSTLPCLRQIISQFRTLLMLSSARLAIVLAG
jgi:hypothetical protein